MRRTPLDLVTAADKAKATVHQGANRPIGITQHVHLLAVGGEQGLPTYEHPDAAPLLESSRTTHTSYHTTGMAATRVVAAWGVAATCSRAGG